MADTGDVEVAVLSATTTTTDTHLTSDEEQHGLVVSDAHAEEEALSGGDTAEIFGLAVDLAQLLLGWSWEGTVGIESKISRTVAIYTENELETLLSAESAIVKMGDKQKFIKALPGVPPLAAMSEFKQWLRSVEGREFTPREARAALQKVKSIEHVYPSVVRVFGAVVLGGAFAVDIAGTWEGVVVAVITAIIAGIHFILAERSKAWALTMPFFAAFFVSLPIFLCYRFEVVEENPGLLAVSPLFIFIPGDGVVIQAVEIIDGRWTAGVARLFYSLMLLVLLAFGILLAAGVTGTPVEDLDPAAEPDFPFWAIYPGHALFLLGTGLLFQMKLSDFPVGTVLTLLVTVVAQGFTALLGEQFGNLLGSITMVISACFVARKPHRSPAYVFMLTPFFCLTPGSHGLRGFEAVLSGDTVTGYDDFWSLIEILITIALGIIGGFLVVRRIGWPHY